MATEYTNTGCFQEKIRRNSWGAIFAGALTALAVAFLLNLLGLGIGLSSINPLTESDPLSGLGIGTIIWLGLSNLAALFLGGMVAGRMSGFSSKADGGIHGFLAWALYAVVTFYFLTSTIGFIMSGLGNAVSGIFGSDSSQQITVQVDKAEQQSQEKATLALDEVKREVLQIISTAERYDVLPEGATEETRETISQTGSQVKGLVKSMDIEEFFNDLEFDINEKGELEINLEGDGEYLKKDELKEYLTQNSDLTETEIDRMIQNWEERIENAVNDAEALYADAKQKALELSDKISDAVGTFSIIAFGVLLLGALAGYFGGSLGSPEYTVTEGHRIKQREERNK
ncbi:MAG: TIGR04086 family membrane protein [Bacteroidota bacterium]